LNPPTSPTPTLRNSTLTSFFPLKILAVETPLPSEFTRGLLGVGIDICFVVIPHHHVSLKVHTNPETTLERGRGRGVAYLIQKN